jgi:hypothetical protein
LNKNTRTWQRALFALGVSLCLAGAFLMVNGSIFGDRTIGIAIVTGIIGIGLISTFTKAVGRKGFNKSQSKTADVKDGWR